jgi:uncharacterized protein (DUF169 family)
MDETMAGVSESSPIALAERLKAVLGLEHEPIAIAFGSDPLPDVTAYAGAAPSAGASGRTGVVPAGCCFWAEAETATFATTAADHANCSVGSYTHGLMPLEEAATRDDTQALLASGWVAQADLAGTPAVGGEPRHVTYGPLRDAPFVPDVVLMRLTPEALMTLQSACPELQLAGKPQCQIIPRAREQGWLVSSLGCAVSRARTGLPASEMTCALPAGELVAIVERLERGAQADEMVTGFAHADRERFASG